MHVVWQVLATILTVYWIVFIARLILDLVQMLARNWTPRGPLLLLAELIYTLTDPPLRALRRIIPPLRIGYVAFDLAFLIVIFGLNILIGVLNRLA